MEEISLEDITTNRFFFGSLRRFRWQLCDVGDRFLHWKVTNIILSFQTYQHRAKFLISNQSSSWWLPAFEFDVGDASVSSFISTLPCFLIFSCLRHFALLFWNHTCTLASVKSIRFKSFSNLILIGYWDVTKIIGDSIRYQRGFEKFPEPDLLWYKYQDSEFLERLFRARGAVLK